MDGRRRRAPWWERAKQICVTCPVRQECLAFALTVPAEVDKVGIVGGLDPAERRALRPPPGPRLYGPERLAKTDLYRGGRSGPDPRTDAHRPRDGDGAKRGRVRDGLCLPSQKHWRVIESTGKGFNPSVADLWSPFMRTPRRPRPASDCG